MKLALLPALVLTVPLAPAAAQGPAPLQATVEHYYDSSNTGTSFRARWFQARWAPNAHLKIVGGSANYANRNVLDENYVEVMSRETRVRVGRLRPGFGLSQWDMWYLGFPAQAALRTRALGRFRLAGYGTGVDVRGFVGPGEYQVGLVNPTPGRYALLSPRPAFAVGRYQQAVGNTIVGINLLSNGHRNTLYGLDYQWSRPNLVVLGEAVTGRFAPARLSDAYANLIYRLPGLQHLSLLARVESGQQPQAGLKFVVTPHLTLQGVKQSGRGWTLQTFTSVKL